jgi:hypothetical protein
MFPGMAEIQVEVFWIMTTCSVVVGYNHLYPEDGGSMDLRNIGILPLHYTASQSIGFWPPSDPDLSPVADTAALSVPIKREREYLDEYRSP